MMTELLDQTLAYLRMQFSAAEVKTLREYGGEFGAADMAETVYTAPAIFVSVLGSRPIDAGGVRMAGNFARQVRMAAFVVTKDANREKRMRTALALGEKLAMVLRAWKPDGSSVTCTIAPLEHSPSCENLFNHARDAAGQAVWMLDWTQGVEPKLPDAQIIDWLSLQITDNVRRAVPAAAAVTGATLNVSESVQFLTT